MLEIKFTQEKTANKSMYFLVLEAKESNQLELSEGAITIDAKYNGLITKFAEESKNFKGEFGKIQTITTIDDVEGVVSLSFVGLGAKDSLNFAKLQDIGGHIAKNIKARNLKSADLIVTPLPNFAESIMAANIAFGASIGSYSFNKYKTKEKTEEIQESIELSLSVKNKEDSEKEFEYFHHIIDGIFSARDVVSEPGNILYPETYSQIIEDKLIPLGVEVEVIGESEMKSMGMNALLGVGQGSVKESRLVVMKYNGAGNDGAPIVLVGKGVTFDTGGISIKPSRNMGDMKYDMAGSAAVFGTILSVASRKDKVNLVGIVGLVENMPGGNAQRPGDVVTSMSGKTIEILDTDAEGRLVLADALWYGEEKFKPKFMIDLATLTGAITISLASAYAGLFSNNDELAKNLIDAGNESGERLWRMPLDEMYDKMIESPIADVANLGSPAGHAGSSTAAQFLQKFVNNVPWAHLDIASVANSSKDLPTAPKGATGFGIRLLNKLISKYYD
ncbi:MAG: leucyl aminopeptidase [Alphaproteobacteria bacterium]|nr:leucyl aminopeptidase [Alphaproteobacteria bacterium]